MKANQFAESIALVLFIIGALVMANGSNIFGQLIIFGSITWYLVKGRHLSGWVGSSYEELLSDKEHVESLIKELDEYADDEPPNKQNQRQKLYKREAELIWKLARHPDNPDNKKRSLDTH